VAQLLHCLVKIKKSKKQDLTPIYEEPFVFTAQFHNHVRYLRNAIPQFFGSSHQFQKNNDKFRAIGIYILYSHLAGHGYRLAIAGIARHPMRNRRHFSQCYFLKNS
jgi:hypothetical protein